MQYSDIKKDIKLILNNQGMLGVKISGQTKGFDPRKSKIHKY